MNNSELSTMTQSADAFAAPPPYACPTSWDDLADERMQDDSPFHDAIQLADSTTGHAVRVMPECENRAKREIPPPDRGLWLLYGSAIRHDHWERLQNAPQDGASSRKVASFSDLVKGAFDAVGALLLLIALFPLFLCVAVLIKLDSPGPILFRHNRVGQNGRCFVLWKFRSMKTDVPQYEASPRNAVDARLTRVGRLIRRLSVDEMPQLINVLKGEMSLVGPRPEMLFLVDRYHPVGCERQTVKPGITGLWQISPARAFPIHENLEYDLHYVRNRNFCLDCAIILRTITAVVHGVGAV
jgi:lipopolysaccharide/colanic/teichoic acid biosynthesis glycosyltransferase